MSNPVRMSVLSLALLAAACNEPAVAPLIPEASDALADVQTAETYTNFALAVAPAFVNSEAWDVNPSNRSVGVSWTAGPQVDGMATTWALPTSAPTLMGRPVGHTAAMALGINNAGTIAGTAWRANGTLSGWRWTAATGFTLVPNPGGVSNLGVVDISNAGTVVGRLYTGGTSHAFRQASGGAVIDMHQFLWDSSAVEGIAANGVMVGWASTFGILRTVQWSAVGVPSVLGLIAPPGPNMKGKDVNNSGTMTGFSFGAAGGSSALWSTGLAGPPVFNVLVEGGEAISNRLRVVGTQVLGLPKPRAVTQLATFPPGLLTVLPVPPAASSRALGVNPCGDVVGSRTNANNTRAIYWRTASCDP